MVCFPPDKRKSSCYWLLLVFWLLLLPLFVPSPSPWLASLVPFILPWVYNLSCCYFRTLCGLAMGLLWCPFSFTGIIYPALLLRGSCDLPFMVVFPPVLWSLGSGLQIFHQKKEKPCLLLLAFLPLVALALCWVCCGLLCVLSVAGVLWGSCPCVLALF